VTLKRNPVVLIDVRRRRVGRDNGPCRRTGERGVLRSSSRSSREGFRRGGPSTPRLLHYRPAAAEGREKSHFGEKVTGWHVGGQDP